MRRRLAGPAIIVDRTEAAEPRVPGVYFGGRDLEPPAVEAGSAPADGLVRAQVLELEQHVELREAVLGRTLWISFPFPQPLRGRIAVPQPGAQVWPSHVAATRRESGHRATTRMTADDEIAHLQDVERELDGGRLRLVGH